MPLARMLRIPHARPGERLEVGMGALATAEGDGLLTIHGLGSCIAIALHTQDRRWGALAHAVVPQRRATHGARAAWGVPDAVDSLVRSLEDVGARGRLVARIAGGANMLRAHAGLQIGTDNARAALMTLARAHIPVLSRDLGGTTSRRIQFRPAAGHLQITRAVGAPGEPPAGGELAIDILNETIQPLGTWVGRPMTLVAGQVAPLTRDGFVACAGGPAAQLRYAFSRHPTTLRIVPILVALGAEHAEALARLAGADDDVDGFLDEGFNILSSHAATALGRVLGLRLAPTLPAVGLRSAEVVLDTLERWSSLPTWTALRGRARLDGAEIDLCIVVSAADWATASSGQSEELP